MHWIIRIAAIAAIAIIAAASISIEAVESRATPTSVDVPTESAGMADPTNR
ncbi:MAG: hypothetical protein AAF467_17210 [Actinomycetota bacterium]